jgi:hypothetical protein
MVTRRTIEIIDQIVFYALTIAAIVIYFEVDRNWGLYLVIGMIVVIVLSYIPQFLQFGQRIKYSAIYNFCKGKGLVKEEAIGRGIKKSPDEIHKLMFEMSRALKTGPLVIFAKRYYLFVEKEIVLDVVSRLDKVLKNDAESGSGIGDLIKQLIAEYGFETRAEAEALIAKIRENKLIMEPKTAKKKK